MKKYAELATHHKEMLLDLLYLISALSAIALFPFQQIPWKQSEWMQNYRCGAEPDRSVLLGLLLPSTGAAGQRQWGHEETTAGEAGSWRDQAGRTKLLQAQPQPQIFTDKCCWSDDGLGT